MHSYLRSIGFSDIKNRRQLTPITKEIIANPTTKNIVTVDADTRLVQLNKDFGKHFFHYESGTDLYRKTW